MVINCPTEELFYMMANILESFGIGYASGENIIDVGGWNEYEDDFCFYVDRTGKILHGPKCSTEDSPYDRYKKCTFYGVMPDFDVASNDEISPSLRDDWGVVQCANSVRIMVKL